MVEYLDIVDEADNVIGKDTRENVHERHEIHRGVHVFVISSRGEILLQHRSFKKDYYPGYYDASVGAQVISGETYEQAAKREIEEELGFKPATLSRICDYKSYSDRQRENRRLFTCNYDGPFNISKDELDSVEWLSPESIESQIEAGKKKFTEGFKLSFQEYSRQRV